MSSPTKRREESKRKRVAVLDSDESDDDSPVVKKVVAKPTSSEGPVKLPTPTKGTRKEFDDALQSEVGYLRKIQVFTKAGLTFEKAEACLAEIGVKKPEPPTGTILVQVSYPQFKKLHTQ